MRDMNNWTWHGHPGHFILSNRARFILHTHTESHCISTVGDLHKIDDPYEYDDFALSAYGERYETQVQPLSDKLDELVKSNSCLEGARCPGGLNISGYEYTELVRYKTCQEANEGHYGLCRKYDNFTAGIH